MALPYLAAAQRLTICLFDNGCSACGTTYVSSQTPAQCAGWNTGSLTAHDETRTTVVSAVTNRSAPQSKEDMFSVLQLRNPQNQPDAWFGHTAIGPSAGKKSVRPPPDPKGRKGLFQVPPFHNFLAVQHQGEAHLAQALS